MIILTFDTDWVPEEILKEIILELTKKNIKATVFASNEYKILKNPPKNVEVAIHPNFDKGGFEEQTKSIFEIYPKSIGVRNHSLAFSERLRPIWSDLRLKYASNYAFHLEPNIKPFFIAKDVIEFPVYFMDRFYLEMTEPNTNFDLTALKLDQPGLKIFDFHPVHLALNTPTLRFYDENKHFYQLPDKLKLAAYKGRGIRTLYSNLLDHIEKNKIETYMLRELTNK